MLFSTNFCTPSEAEEQIDAYLCEVPDEEDESPEFSEEQRELCRERVAAVLTKLAEIDETLTQASSGWSLRQMGRVELTTNCVLTRAFRTRWPSTRRLNSQKNSAEMRLPPS